uniref:Uncharacterized protein n=1 Tax=Apteryx owenii TaxID=8824 RepID=A0A8B9QAG8_APTOW
TKPRRRLCRRRDQLGQWPRGAAIRLRAQGSHSPSHLLQPGMGWAGNGRPIQPGGDASPRDTRAPTHSLRSYLFHRDEGAGAPPQLPGDFDSSVLGRRKEKNNQL